MGKTRRRRAGRSWGRMVTTTNRDGSVSERKFPLPRSFAIVKRGFSEQKSADAKDWARKQLARTGNRKYRPREKLKPDPTVAKANKRLASRFYQMKTGHCLTGQYLAWTTRRPDATCWWCQYSIQTREHLFKNCPQWRCQQKTLWTTVLKETKKLPGPTRDRDRTKIAELLADERCNQAVLQFLATTDVGRTSGPPVAEDEEDAASEASGMGSEGSGETGLGEEGGGGSFGEGVTRRAGGFSSFFSSSLSLNFLRLSFVFTITGAKSG